MRIASLVNLVGPTRGGIDRVMDQLGRGYIDAGHQRLLVMPGTEDRVRSSRAGTVLTIASPALSASTRLILSPGKVIAALKRFRATNLEVSDKLTLTGVTAWAKKQRLPTMLLSHARLDNAASAYLDMEMAPLIRIWNRRLGRLYQKVVVTSAYSADEWLTTHARLAIVPLGVDLKAFRLPSPRPQGERLELLFVGRLARDKGAPLAVATTVELVRRGIDVALHMHGTGPLLDELKAMAGDVPVYFHGFTGSQHSLRDAYQGADISLSPSPTESFGLAALESLACGTPVVCANRGGVRELVDANCAEWASPDPVFLADAVLRLDQRRRLNGAALQLAARQRAQQYPWASTVERMLTIHQQLLDELV
ncbi:MAG: glycosyltransferase [Propionibacteriaceae bacterium]|jgi:alpha-1,6-mannosyltransferase|nr:glycosyltransferase [Propionibacteriaceae bacterium]